MRRNWSPPTTGSVSLSSSFPRELFESPQCTAQLDALPYDRKDIEQALFGLTWAIATEPEVFPQIAWGIRAAVSRSFMDIPPLLMIFRVDDDRWECELLSVSLADKVTS